MNLRPIKPKRVSSQVFEQLRELLYRGVFIPGEQLPPERELAAAMQVSRTSVRNALEKLVHLGLLMQIQGQGTFVTAPENRTGTPFATSISTDEVTFLDLLEVRMGLECNGASLAAQRASLGDLRAMKKCLDEMGEDLDGNGTISTTADTAFHMAIIFSTKNPVLINLTRNFYDFLFVGIKKNLTHMQAHHRAYDQVMAQHLAIYRAINDRQPEQAGQAMRNHILFVRDFFAKRTVELPVVPRQPLAA